MSTPQEGELNREELALFEQDLQDLRAAQEAHGTNLESRVQYGLDPAGMMALRDTAPQVDKIAEMLGTTTEKVWPLIDELHKQGPWKLADRLKNTQDPEAQTYLVLAAACHEKRGLTRVMYIEDRARVVQELSSFTTDQLQARKDTIAARIKTRHDVKRTVAGKEVVVPVADGDPALALSMEGYKGCVAMGGEDRFAQTSHVDDALLKARGLVPGFCEKYDPEKVIQTPTGPVKGAPVKMPLEGAPAGARVVWVVKEEAGQPIEDMTPVAKRIGEGFVLTYKNEDLAVDLVAQAVQAEQELKYRKQYDALTEEFQNLASTLGSHDPRTIAIYKELENLRKEFGL